MNDEGDRCQPSQLLRAGRLEPDCDAGGIGAEIFDLEHGSQEQASCCRDLVTLGARRGRNRNGGTTATAGRCSHGSQVLHLSSTPVLRFLSGVKPAMMVTGVFSFLQRGH